MVLLLLVACVPKYQFTHPERSSQPISHIDVILDFVSYVDDVGDLMDYDEVHNQAALLALKEKIKSMLVTKGYDSVAFISVSSGATLHPDIDFELYANRQFQNQLINPPFYMMAEGIDVDAQDRLLATMRQFQSPAMVPVKDNTHRYLHRLTMSPRMYHHDWLKSDSNAAVLFVQVSHPRVSLVKSLGVSVAAGVTSSGLSGGSVVATVVPYGAPHSQALLFDWESGGLIWKNHSQGLLNRMTAATLARYFSDFPSVK